MNLYKYFLYIFLIFNIVLLSPVSGFLIKFILERTFGLIFDYFFEDTVNKFVGPALKFAVSSPTAVVSNALVEATPLLTPSIFGERIDQMAINAISSIISFYARLIRDIIDRVINSVVTGVQAGVSAVGTALNILANLSPIKREGSILLPPAKEMNIKTQDKGGSISRNKRRKFFMDFIK